MANVTIKYNNEIIGELNNLGSLIMKTAGHACEFDIELDYINHCPRGNPVASFSMGDFYNMFQPTTSIATFSLTNPLTAYRTDYSPGSVQDGVWYDTSTLTNCFNDIYQVEANKTYLIKLGSTVSNRFRVMFTTEDVTQTSGEVVGVDILMNNSPSANASVVYTTSANGYIIIQKTNNSTTGISTFVYEGDV